MSPLTSVVQPHSSPRGRTIDSIDATKGSTTAELPIRCFGISRFMGRTTALDLYLIAKGEGTGERGFHSVRNWTRGDQMRGITLVTTCAAALGFLACNSEQSPTEPSTTAAFAKSAQYRAIDLGALNGLFSEALAINPAGQVVGFTGTPALEVHAFLWEKGVMTDLGTLGGTRSEAHGINAAGQVVGLALTEAEQFHAFIWQKGVMMDLGTLGGITSSAEAINPAGQVVGNWSTASGEEHAFLWQKGVMTDLGASEHFIIAQDINPAG
jgi:probable HAF family extracellular repeat protein